MSAGRGPLARAARGATLILGTWLLPSLAAACPTCATREGAGLWGLALMGGMIALPFIVAGVTVTVVRRLERRE